MEAVLWYLLATIAYIVVVSDYFVKRGLHLEQGWDAPGTQH
jgi:hypothetical protein